MKWESSSKKSIETPHFGWEGLSNGGEIYYKGSNQTIPQGEQIKSLLEGIDVSVDEPDFDFYISEAESLFSETIKYIDKIEKSSGFKFSNKKEAAYKLNKSIICRLHQENSDKYELIIKIAKEQYTRIKSDTEILVSVVENTNKRKEIIKNILEDFTSKIDKNSYYSFILLEIEKYRDVIELDLTEYNNQNISKVRESYKNLIEYIKRLKIELFSILDSVDLQFLSDDFVNKWWSEITEKFKNKETIDTELYIKEIKEQQKKQNISNVTIETVHDNLIKEDTDTTEFNNGIGIKL